MQGCVCAMLTELFCTRLNQSLCGETESMSTTKLHACRAHSTVLCSNCFAATETESMSLKSVQDCVRAVLTVLLCARLESLCGETESMSLNARLRAGHAHTD